MIDERARRKTGDVLILDDDPSFGKLLVQLLEFRGYSARHCLDFESAVSLLNSVAADVMILDYQLKEQQGTDLLLPLSEIAPEMPVLLMTAHGTTDVALDAIQHGAFDFLTKPVDEARLLASVSKAVSHHDLLSEIVRLQEAGSQLTEFKGIIGGSAAMGTIFRAIENVSPTTVPVMIRGESGTGKELVARAIHASSGRAEEPFVALNMAALPKDLVESTLFGHEKGAFTGAVSRRVGACEEAGCGTLFLDEICEMPLELQAKLLRFLQEGVFRRIGGTKDVQSRARILSATNRDPLGEVRERRFREDLYYRLNVVPIDLPPLRQRGSDVSLLAKHALKVFAERHGKPFRSIDPIALDVLSAYQWPGNVRELFHIIERTVVLHDSDIMTLPMLPAEVRTSVGSMGAAYADSERLSDGVVSTEPEEGAGQTVDVLPADVLPADDISPAGASSSASSHLRTEGSEALSLAEVERRAIFDAIVLADGSVASAAQRLEVSAATIYRKLKSYGVTAHEIVASSDSGH